MRVTPTGLVIYSQTFPSTYVLGSIIAPLPGLGIIVLPATKFP
jgi:hypothetical protein